MMEFDSQINQWLEKGKKFAIGRVIKTWGSGPRPVGSAMLISEEGEMVGSVSGGCVENDVVKSAQDVLTSGKSRMLNYGIANEEAWTVGLTCGGKIDVFVEPFWSKDIWGEIQRLSGKVPFALLTKLAKNPEHRLVTIAQKVTFLENEIGSCFRKRSHGFAELSGENWFIQLFPKKYKLLIIGAAHVATELVRLATHYDFETIIIDPRQVFTEKTQFPVAPNQIFSNYPSEVLPDIELDPYVFVAILSHDPKIDDNALEVLLRSDVSYIGAMGSKKTHAKRVERLKEKGFSVEEISGIHAPIGLDIQTKAAKEIALSIMAEIVGVKNDTEKKG